MTNPTWSYSESRTLTRFSVSALILTLTVASSLLLVYTISQFFSIPFIVETILTTRAELCYACIVKIENAT